MRELISHALKERFREICDERIPSLDTAACGPANFFIQVRRQLSGISPADARNLIHNPRGPGYWTTSDIGCRRSLLLLSLGQRLELRDGEHPPVKPFVELLNAARADHGRCVQLLSERYSNPLNFILAEEEKAREFILMRLLTHDRARVEKEAGGTFEREREDLLLLKLNLVAVMAARTPDLRFLDALNYYYELLPAWCSPTGHHDALLASYFALYAQALAARM